MANILLIEPDYKCKYPPLGLMKIAYYHKEIRKDFVWFAKGKLPNAVSNTVRRKIQNSKYYQSKFKGENIDTDIFASNVNEIIKDIKWDRVYISTLFTYEYNKTIEAINYAKELVDRNLNRIFVGGIAATLLPEKFEVDTGIKPITGQLINSSMIGYKDSVDIDNLVPDYSILDNVDYEYSNSDAYYAYTTRGCGMKCGFCAVQKLEPQYKSYISIQDQISEINDKYGKKKDLLLMDNNVLKSPKFTEIIQDIIDLGFQKSATYINPKTNNHRNRYVDFNQGLDAKLFTEEKVKELSKIAIKPARIAFDHIEDREIYEKVIRLAVKHGISNLSNYLLYNSDDFSGKGTNYKADTPEDLYERLRINVELQEKLNIARENRDRVHIFSFPMRYIPLEDTDRGYVGPMWTTKYLRAIQAILIPTQGKGVSSKSFFEAAFGRNVEEFKEVLLMPENYIATRGEPGKIKDIDEEERKEKYKTFQHWQKLRNEWRKLFYKLNDIEKAYFKEKIGINEFTYKVFQDFNEGKYRKLFIHYFSENSLLVEVFENLYMDDEEEILDEIKDYILNDGIEIYNSLVKYISESTIMNKQKDIYIKVFGYKGILDILCYWVRNNKINESSFRLMNEYDNSMKDKVNINKILWILKEKVELSDEELKLLEEKIILSDFNSLEYLLNKKMDEVYKLQVNKVKFGKLAKEQCLDLFKVIYKDTKYKPN